MKLTRLKILDVHKVFIDNLECWVEMPIFDQEELIKLVNEIDWEELSMTDYKRIVVQGWPGLSSAAKVKLRTAAARDEFYNLIVKENWGLAPGAALDQQRPYYPLVESENVRLWFASHKAQGRGPDVL